MKTIKNKISIRMTLLIFTLMVSTQAMANTEDTEDSFFFKHKAVISYIVMGGGFGVIVLGALFTSINKNKKEEPIIKKKEPKVGKQSRATKIKDMRGGRTKQTRMVPERRGNPPIRR